jgi:hypothetical protein
LQNRDFGTKQFGGRRQSIRDNLAPKMLRTKITILRMALGVASPYVCVPFHVMIVISEEVVMWGEKKRE